MKRLAWLPALVLMAACGEAPTQPVDSDLLVRSEMATTSTTNLKVPISRLVVVPCADGGAGDLVLLEGTLHVLTHTTIDANGGLHLKVHFQPQGVSGTGLITGDTYRGTGVTQQKLNMNASGLPVTFTLVDNFRIIGPGPGNNLLVHQNVHLTINENGVVTADVDNTSVDCK